jgi:hypothetical protein
LDPQTKDTNAQNAGWDFSPTPKSSKFAFLEPRDNNDGYSSLIKALEKEKVKDENLIQKREEMFPREESVKGEGLLRESNNLDTLTEDDAGKGNSSENENASSEDVFQQNNIEAPDTLDSLLNFLKTSGSPVSGLLDLRSLLLEQKEEKVMLRTLVDQMKVDIAGLR